MYESPITIIVGDIQSQIIENEDGEMLVQMRQSIGYNVDKDELLKALQYDRNQYEKGYKDGRPKWIPVSDDHLPKNDDFVIITIKDESGDYPYIYSDFGWYLDKADCWIVDAQQRTDVIAWMPLPKPYEPQEGAERE